MHKFIGITAALALLASSSAFRTTEAVPITGGTGPGGVGTTDGASTGLQLWLRSDTGITESGGLVSGWADESGHGRDVTSSGDNRPTFVSSRATFNNRPVLDFVATTVTSQRDFLSGNFLTVPGDTARTVFVVSQTDNNVNRVILDLGDSTESDGALYQVTPEVALRVFGNIVFDEPLPTTTSSVLMLRSATGADVNETEAFIDGAELGEESATTALLDTTGETTIGAARFGSQGTAASAAFNGDIAEVAVFNTELNEAQRRIVENAFSAKYDMAVAGDLYAGDDPGIDYDRDVFGVGQVDASNLVDNTGSQGFGIEATAGLGDGEFVLAGHNVETNSLVDFEGPLAEGQRWDRVWYVDTNASSVDVNLGFNFSDAGIGGEFDAADNFSLLYSATDDFSSWTFLSTSANVVGDTVFFDVSSADLANGFYTLGVNAALVPEPSTVLLVGLGALWMHGRRRRPGRCAARKGAALVPSG